MHHYHLAPYFFLEGWGTGSQHVAQADLELAILLPLPLEYLECSLELSKPSLAFVFASGLNFQPWRRKEFLKQKFLPRLSPFPLIRRLSEMGAVILTQLGCQENQRRLLM